MVTNRYGEPHIKVGPSISLGYANISRCSNSIIFHERYCLVMQLNLDFYTNIYI